MFIRSIRIFLFLSLLLILLTCGFEADKSLLSSVNSMDINVRCGNSTVYDGQGFYIGVVNSGSTKDFTFTIENIGSGGSLELTGTPIVSISGAGFSIITQPDKTALAPGEKTNFTVHFAPTAVQAYQGIVTILNNDIGESDYAFGLLSENFVLPNAPSVTGLATTNNTKPEWTWTTGGNGSGTFRYKLDSSDLTTGATETTETRFTPATPIPPGNHVLYVQEQDTGGKFWSIYGSFTTNVRLNPPTISGTTSPTANTKPTWTWSTGNDGNGTFRYKLDSSDFSSGATITTATSYTPTDPIPPGYHYLYVQEQDINETFWSSYRSFSIYIRFRAPVVTGTTPIADTTPTWTWTSGGDGNGTYRCKVNSSDFSTGTTQITGTSFTPTVPLPPGVHYLYVQEHDASGLYWSETGYYALQIRFRAPVVTGTSPTGDTTPTWSWTSGGDGNGTYRCKIDSSDLSIGATVTIDMNYTPSIPLTPGYHSLYVQEFDTTGLYWSDTGSKSIQIRFRAPIVTGTTPTADTTPTWSWTSGGDGNGTYRYKVDSSDLSTGATVTTDTSYTPPVPISPGYHSLYVQELDTTGLYWSDTGSKSIQIRFRAPVVTGTSPTGDTTPTWSWTSGGDGNGTYRYKLDSSDLSSGATVTTDTSYTPPVPMLPGSHSLYIQEQELSETYWSDTGSRTINIQLTPPVVSGIDATSDSIIIWTWNTGGGNGNYRYKLDSNDFSSGSTETVSTSFTAGPLPDGNHTLYVQEKDANGAFWSQSGSFTSSIKMMSAVGWIGGGSNGWKKTNGASAGSGYQNFNYPNGLFIDSEGNIYISDSLNNRIIKWDANGNAIGWIGGGSNGWKTTSGASSGNGYQSFYRPSGVFMDSSGNIYVADNSNHRISKWDASGNAIGWIGGGSNGWKIGSGAPSGNGYQSFSRPSGVFIDSSGNIYVADNYNHRISKWDASGNAIGWIGGGSNGWKTGSGAPSGNGYQSFYNPGRLYFDSLGNIYIEDGENNRISKWDPDGNAIGWIGGGSNGWKTTSGASSGNGFQSFYYTTDVFLDSSGNIYVADNYNHRISKWDASGNAIGWIGGDSNGWKTASGASSGNGYKSFYCPSRMFIDISGNIFVTDTGNNRISKWHQY